ncbi:hypothetical protein NDN08_006443 [Rhodosorus marinus]|uniref:Uncharacterized protein n=1 Tax=Rhodosorus marinus TaxID=101924 RepID=A0AAV8UHQ2_9RHOD|nr:hypothetical protein NDN08_006443 [Rhodosorus marinus]
MVLSFQALMHLLPRTRAVAGASVCCRMDLSTTAIGFAKKAVLGAATSMVLVGAAPAPPIDGNCPECLGIVDGLLADCPEDSFSCVSSQDDAPLHFHEPWEYDGTSSSAQIRLERLLETEYTSRVITSRSGYILIEFFDALGNVDDAEFYFTPGDNLIQFRSNRRGGGTDLGANKLRMEGIRKKLRFAKVPVLRNRRRVFVFFESPFDSFGPGTSKNMDVRKAEDGPATRFDFDPLSPVPRPLHGKRGSQILP